MIDNNLKKSEVYDTARKYKQEEKHPSISFSSEFTSCYIIMLFVPIRHDEENLNSVRLRKDTDFCACLK